MQKLVVICLIVIAVLLIIDLQNRVVCVHLSIDTIIRLLTVKSNFLHGIFAISKSFITR